MNSEQRRLEETRNGTVPWKKWGPYLSERQWGTVREDYSENGNAWDYFSHDQARRALITGARTDWPASPTTSSVSVSLSRSGTERIPSSRSACSD